MIRNLMLAAGLFAFTAGSAMAATQPHVARVHHKVAQTSEAPATGDAAAKEPGKKAKKAHKGGKKTKAEGATKAEGTDMKAPAPAPAPAPAK